MNHWNSKEELICPASQAYWDRTMFHLIDEGERPLWGFNFYPLSSAQFGFRFRTHHAMYYFRFSKTVRRWFVRRAHG